MTSTSPLVSTERVGADVLLVRLDGPPVNALTQDMTAALGDAIDRLHDEPSRAVVVTGVPGRFCAGGDIARFGALTDNESAAGFVDTAQLLFDRLAAVPAPVIAAIDGYALGGGLELALACDVRVASPRSTLGLPETRWGLLAGAGGTQRLARLVGTGAAKLLMFTAAPVDAAEAWRIGLVDALADDPVAEALAIAHQIAANSPRAVQAVKRCVDVGGPIPLADGLRFEARQWVELVAAGDHREGAAAFFERRDPRYAGTG